MTAVREIRAPPLRRHFMTPKVAQMPMTLGNAAAARFCLIVCCLPFRRATRLRRVPELPPSG
jgi:hypothetical protein